MTESCGWDALPRSCCAARFAEGGHPRPPNRRAERVGRARTAGELKDQEGVGGVDDGALAADASQGAEHRVDVTLRLEERLSKCIHVRVATGGRELESERATRPTEMSQNSIAADRGLHRWQATSTYQTMSVLARARQFGLAVLQHRLCLTAPSSPCVMVWRQQQY